MKCVLPLSGPSQRSPVAADRRRDAFQRRDAPLHGIQIVAVVRLIGEPTRQTLGRSLKAAYPSIRVRQGRSGKRFYEGIALRAPEGANADQRAGGESDRTSDSDEENADDSAAGKSARTRVGLRYVKRKGKRGRKFTYRLPPQDEGRKNTGSSDVGGDQPDTIDDDLHEAIVMSMRECISVEEAQALIREEKDLKGQQ